MEHKAVLTKVPSHTPTNTFPDGAVTGNGDVAVILYGTPDKIKLFISKADFWKADPGDRSAGGICPMAVVEVLAPSLENAPYRVEQRMDEGEIFCEFGEATLTARVCASENIVLLDVDYHCKYQVNLCALENGTEGCEDTVSYVSRSFAKPEYHYPTHGIVAMKKLEKNRYAFAVSTNHDTPAYKTIAINRVRELNADEYSYLLFSHRAWWSDFWKKSSVCLYDEEIENYWYAGQYFLACCARNRNFAPGLYGNFVTSDHMSWHGDLHLNYNYEAPFYALVSSNHVELTECYHAALEDFLPEAKYNAREYLDCRGVYYPVGIGPKGLNTSSMKESIEHGELFLGQKSNASYAAVVIVMRWYGTYDLEYAREHAYPFLRECGEFWEDYLKFEDGRYVDYDDCIHEEPYYLGKDYVLEFPADFNPLFSLGAIRMVFRCLLDISSELDIDADRRAKWQHILEHLSEYPTFMKDGKKVFRYTERGREWVDVNSVNIQHIYPAGQIGLDSPPELLEIARNTFYANDRWTDNNGFSSYYPCAARLLVDPDLIIAKIKENIRAKSTENMLFHFGGGGLENSSAIPATINEMLLQSYEGVLRFFPNWNVFKRAEFTNLRADGAFLVSASANNGEISGITVCSEKGRVLTVENPYPKCAVYVNCVQKDIFEERRFTVETNIGDKIEIKNLA